MSILKLVSDNPDGLTSYEVTKMAGKSSSDELSRLVSKGKIKRVAYTESSNMGTRYKYIPLSVTYPKETTVNDLSSNELEYGQAAENVINNIAAILDENQALRKVIQDIHNVTGRFINGQQENNK